MAFFLLFSKTNLQVSSNEQDQDSAKAVETSSNQADEEQDRASDEEAEEKSVETNQEQVEEDKDEDNKENKEEDDVQRQEEAEEHENKDDYEEEKEDVVNREAVLGAFLQVSEPALVSSHQDGFLRFWNLSVSSFNEQFRLKCRSLSEAFNSSLLDWPERLHCSSCCHHR